MLFLSLSRHSPGALPIPLSHRGVHRDALPRHLHPVYPHVAGGLLGGAERHVPHVSLHRYVAALHGRKPPDIARQLADGLYRQIGQQIIEKLIHKAPPVCSWLLLFLTVPIIPGTLSRKTDSSPHLCFFLPCGRMVLYA